MKMPQSGRTTLRECAQHRGPSRLLRLRTFGRCGYAVKLVSGKVKRMSNRSSPNFPGKKHEQWWSQAWLPLSMGGLGLTHSARICSAAFITSSNMTTELVKNFIIQCTHTITPDSAHPEATQHYESLMMTSEGGGLTTRSQSTLILALHYRA
jgi:hypothetical protein